MKNPINPDHYKSHRDGKDPIQRWYEKYPFDQFRTAMLTHIDKYLDRYILKGFIEDLDKVMEFTRRLKEYELLHAKEFSSLIGGT